MRKQGYKVKKMAAAWIAGTVLSFAAAGTIYAAAQGPASQSGQGNQQQIQEEKLIDTVGFWTEANGKWYFYDSEGYPYSGWIISGGKHYCLNAEGEMLTNCITPDGYYVGPDGAWYQRKTVVLGNVIEAPKKFPAAADAWSSKDAFSDIRTKIRTVFKERRLKVSDNGIEYLAGTDKNERLLMGAYKMPDSGGFYLDLYTSLDPSSIEINEAETYDYLVFKTIMHQLSSTPDLLETAIYNSWEESNSWNIGRNHWVWIGDALVKYAAESGFGRYYIYPAK